MIFSENRFTPRIKSGAGFFGIMLQTQRTAYRDNRSIVAAGLKFSRLPSARRLIS